MRFDADIVQELLGHMHELLHFLDHTGETHRQEACKGVRDRLAVERALTKYNTQVVRYLLAPFSARVVG